MKIEANGTDDFTLSLNLQELCFLEDAEKECDFFKEDMRYMIEQGYPVWQIEQEFTSYFGVEPDYMIDFIDFV